MGGVGVTGRRCSKRRHRIVVGQSQTTGEPGKECYNQLRLANITDGYEAAIEYLDQLEGGIEAFRKLAEL